MTTLGSSKIFALSTPEKRSLSWRGKVFLIALGANSAAALTWVAMSVRGHQLGGWSTAGRVGYELSEWIGAGGWLAILASFLSLFGQGWKRIAGVSIAIILLVLILKPSVS